MPADRCTDHLVAIRCFSTVGVRLGPVQLQHLVDRLFLAMSTIGMLRVWAKRRMSTLHKKQMTDKDARYPQIMTTQQETFVTGFVDGIQSVAMPGRNLQSLRQEMQRRNIARMKLIRNLSRSTSRASRSISARSSAK